MTPYSHKALVGHPFRTLLRYLAPYWKECLLGAALSAVFVVVGLITPFVIKTVVNRFQTGGVTVALLFKCFAILISIAAASGVALFWERVLLINASRKAEFDLRNDYFRHVQSLSRDFFHRTQTGDLMARATNDLNYVRMFIGPGIMGTINMIRIPLTLAVMGYLSLKLTMLSLMPLPLITLIMYTFIMYMHHQSEKVQKQYGVVNSRVQENLAGARVVQAYGISDREINAFQEESERYFQHNMKLSYVMAMLWPVIGMIAGLMILFIIWRGGIMVINGDLSLDVFMSFVVAAMLLVWPLVELGWIMSLYQRGLAGMNRINEIFAETPSIRDSENVRRDFAISRGAIQFENVSFAYNDKAVLCNISLTVPAGRTVAIVGPTGSGKSTLVSLLTREYDPTEGRVLIDGVDLREIPLKVLRAAIGYVPQDSFLFSESIRTNIALGRPDASQDEIDYACRVAQFSETVAGLPEGYDTLLGERGINLSGGQKQRLTIARAVICDPRILILDDALSSVDTHTEEQILKGLKTVMSQRTSIIISHRISAIRDADLILVIDEGRIAEQGTHETLLSMNGLYASLYERQLLEEELEGE